MLIKISQVKIQRYGTRGLSITLPNVFANDNGLEPGDTLDIYRGVVEGGDSLVIAKSNKDQFESEDAETTVSEK